MSHMFSRAFPLRKSSSTTRCRAWSARALASAFVVSSSRASEFARDSSSSNRLMSRTLKLGRGLNAGQSRAVCVCLRVRVFMCACVEKQRRRPGFASARQVHLPLPAPVHPLHTQQTSEIERTHLRHRQKNTSRHSKEKQPPQMFQRRTSYVTTCMQSMRD